MASIFCVIVDRAPKISNTIMVPKIAMKNSPAPAAIPSAAVIQIVVAVVIPLMESPSLKSDDQVRTSSYTLLLVTAVKTKNPATYL